MTRAILKEADFQAALQSFKAGMEQLSSALASKNISQPTRPPSPSSGSKSASPSKATTGVTPAGDAASGSKATAGVDPSAMPPQTQQLTPEQIISLADKSDEGLGRVIQNLMPKLEKAGLKITKV